MEQKNENLQVTPKLAFDLNLALYLDLVAVLEGAGVVTYRQMAARVLNVSMDVLEGIAKGFAGQRDGLSIDLLKAAKGVRDDEALGDIPMRPDGI